MTEYSKYKEMYDGNYSFESAIVETMQSDVKYDLEQEEVQQKMDKLFSAIYSCVDDPDYIPNEQKETHDVLFEFIRHDLAKHKKSFQRFGDYNTVFNEQTNNEQTNQKIQSLLFLMLRAVKLYLSLNFDMNELIRDFSGLSLRPQHITCIHEFVENAQEKIYGNESGKKVLFKLMIECLILLDMHSSAKMLLDRYPCDDKQNNLQYIYCDIMCGIEEFDACCIAPTFCFFGIPQVTQSEFRLAQIQSQIDRLVDKRSGLPTNAQKDLDHKLVLLSARQLKLKALPSDGDIIKFCNDVSENIQVDQLSPVDKYLLSMEMRCQTLRNICINSSSVSGVTKVKAIEKLESLTEDKPVSLSRSFA